MKSVMYNFNCPRLENHYHEIKFNVKMPVEGVKVGSKFLVLIRNLRGIACANDMRNWPRMKLRVESDVRGDFSNYGKIVQSPTFSPSGRELAWMQ